MEVVVSEHGKLGSEKWKANTKNVEMRFALRSADEVVTMLIRTEVGHA
jgi:hypothetical protein